MPLLPEEETTIDVVKYFLMSLFTTEIISLCGFLENSNNTIYSNSCQEYKTSSF